MLNQKLREFGQTIAAGEQTYYVDFGLERLDEEEAMAQFGLNQSRLHPGVGG